MRSGAFFEARMDKITEAIKLHLSESMKRDLQDAAMSDDRKVSDYIRHVLAQHLYGIKGTILADGNGAIQGEQGPAA